MLSASDELVVLACVSVVLLRSLVHMPSLASVAVAPEFQISNTFLQMVVSYFVHIEYLVVEVEISSGL
ncbi:hypothetical protein M758_6G121900 [Ceratodon purpureus]|nr:hypothetical protein M758_6G121900 [Ceratodon purpureus]